MFGVLIAALLAGMYFLPAFIAAVRGIRDEGRVIGINVAWGWTIVGWFVALAMAARTDRKETSAERSVSDKSIHGALAQRADAHDAINHQPKASRQATAALVLSIVGLLLTLPSLPDFTFEALGSNHEEATGSQWTYVAWLASPVVGLTALVVAAVARRTMGPASPGVASSRIRYATLLALSGGVSWLTTLFGAAAVGL